jgi:hypothetical protein
MEEVSVFLGKQKGNYVMKRKWYRVIGLGFRREGFFGYTRT